VFFRRSQNDFVYFKNRYWHKKCYEQHHQNKSQQDKLKEYIATLLHKKIDQKINNQIKNYIEVKKYSYQDIYYALHYFFDIKGNSIAKANGGIGIVPYVIDEAKVYFKAKEKQKMETEEVNPIISTKHIKIQNPLLKDKYKENKEINISQL
jgi:hypothetical protein